MSDPRLTTLAKLFVAFPDQRRDARAVGAIYLDALSDLTDAQLSDAVAMCIRSRKFFPAVAELRDAVRPDDWRRLARSQPEHRLFPPEARREPITEESKRRVESLLSSWRSGRTA